MSFAALTTSVKPSKIPSPHLFTFCKAFMEIKLWGFQRWKQLEGIYKRFELLHTVLLKPPVCLPPSCQLGSAKDERMYKHAVTCQLTTPLLELSFARIHLWTLSRLSVPLHANNNYVSAGIFLVKFDLWRVVLTNRHVQVFIFVVPSIAIPGWRNPTRCNSTQIFIYC